MCSGNAKKMILRSCISVSVSMYQYQCLCASTDDIGQKKKRQEFLKLKLTGVHCNPQLECRQTITWLVNLTLTGPKRQECQGQCIVQNISLSFLYVFVLITSRKRY